MTGKKDRWADTSGGVSRTSLDGGPGPTDHRKERWVDVGTRSFDNRRESKWASKWGDKDEKEGTSGGDKSSQEKGDGAETGGTPSKSIAINKGTASGTAESTAGSSWGSTGSGSGVTAAGGTNSTSGGGTSSAATTGGVAPANVGKWRPQSIAGRGRGEVPPVPASNHKYPSERGFAAGRGRGAPSGGDPGRSQAAGDFAPSTGAGRGRGFGVGGGDRWETGSSKTAIGVPSYRAGEVIRYTKGKLLEVYVQHCKTPEFSEPVPGDWADVQHLLQGEPLPAMAELGETAEEKVSGLATWLEVKLDGVLRCAGTRTMRRSRSGYRLSIRHPERPLHFPDAREGLVLVARGGCVKSSMNYKRADGDGNKT